MNCISIFYKVRPHHSSQNAPTSSCLRGKVKGTQDSPERLLWLLFWPHPQALSHPAAPPVTLPPFCSSNTPLCFHLRAFALVSPQPWIPASNTGTVNFCASWSLCLNVPFSVRSTLTTCLYSFYPSMLLLFCIYPYLKHNMLLLFLTLYLWSVSSH